MSALGESVARHWMGAHRVDQLDGAGRAEVLRWVTAMDEWKAGAGGDAPPAPPAALCSSARTEPVRRVPRPRRLLVGAVGVALVVSWGCEPVVDRHVKWLPKDASADAPVAWLKHAERPTIDAGAEAGTDADAGDAAP